MSTSNCDCPCPTAEVTLIPGSQGESGTNGENGTNGINAFTFLNQEGAAIPADTATPTTYTVANSEWMAAGQVVIFSSGEDVAHFLVVSKPSSTSVVLLWRDYNGDAAATTALADGSQISPSGQDFTVVGLPTAFTDNSTGTASDTIAAGVGVQDWFFTHTFIAGTSAVEPVTTWTPGFNFKILGWHAVTSVLLVGASGSRVANMEIDSTDVGTVASTITIPIANAAVGTVTDGTAVSGANTGGPSATFSIEIASGGTEFSAGVVTFVVRVQNMDTANAFASVADHINDLITALT